MAGTTETLDLRSSCFPEAEDTTTGFAFAVTDSLYSFAEGQLICESVVGGEVVSIHSSEENNELAELLSNVSSAFVGLVENSPQNLLATNLAESFNWTDNSTVDFGVVSGELPWAANQPQIGVGQECTILNADSGLWESSNCSSVLQIACKIPCELEEEDEGGLLDKIEDFISDNLIISAVIGGVLLLLIGLCIFAIIRRSQKEPEYEIHMEDDEEYDSKHIKEKRLSGVAMPGRASTKFDSLRFQITFGRKKRPVTSLEDFYVGKSGGVKEDVENDNFASQDNELHMSI